MENSAPLCYNPFCMKYQKSLLLYQDEPSYGLLLRIIFVAVPASLLISSYYLFSSGEREGGLVLLFEAFFIGLIFLSVFPRKYQVYEDHIRIVLGGPFSIKVGFEKIKKINVVNNSGFSFTVNYATKITKNYVQIDVNRGMNITITPEDNGLFVENANRAMADWSKTRLVQG